MTASPGRRRHNADPNAILENYEFVAPDPARSTLRLTLFIVVLFVLAAGGYAWIARTHASYALVGVAVAAAVVVWTLLLGRSPQVVTVQRSIIFIRKGDRVDRFDMVDPNLEIFVRDGEMEFHYYDGRSVLLRPGQVDWKTFLNVVMHYQNYADEKAVERVQRYER